MKGILMEGNPLATLGIPRDIVVREYEARNFEKLAALANGFYKVLAKQYSPDRESGDAELMVRYNQAIGDLYDPDMLEYFASEIADDDPGDRRGLRRIVNDIEARTRQSLERTVRSFEKLNQFDIIGRETAASCFIQAPIKRYVLDIQSADRTDLYRVSSSHRQALSESVTDIDCQYGTWQEYQVDEQYHQTSVIYDMRIHMGTVRLVGGYIVEDTSPLSPSGRSELEASRFDDALEWVDPPTAWFLPSLEFRLEPGMYAVVCNTSGQLASVGLVAAIK